MSPIRFIVTCTLACLALLTTGCSDSDTIDIDMPTEQVTTAPTVRDVVDIPLSAFDPFFGPVTFGTMRIRQYTDDHITTEIINSHFAGVDMGYTINAVNVQGMTLWSRSGFASVPMGTTTGEQTLLTHPTHIRFLQFSVTPSGTGIAFYKSIGAVG